MELLAEVYSWQPSTFIANTSRINISHLCIIAHKGKITGVINRIRFCTGIPVGSTMKVSTEVFDGVDVSADG